MVPLKLFSLTQKSIVKKLLKHAFAMLRVLPLFPIFEHLDLFRLNFIPVIRSTIDIPPRECSFFGFDEFNTFQKNTLHLLFIIYPIQFSFDKV